jgi:hypothetical protein
MSEADGMCEIADEPFVVRERIRVNKYNGEGTVPFIIESFQISSDGIHVRFLDQPYCFP